MPDKVIIELEVPSLPLPADLLADKRALSQALAVALYRQRKISM